MLLRPSLHAAGNDHLTEVVGKLIDLLRRQCRRRLSALHKALKESTGLHLQFKCVPVLVGNSQNVSINSSQLGHIVPVTLTANALLEFVEEDDIGISGIQLVVVLHQVVLKGRGVYKEICQ